MRFIIVAISLLLLPVGQVALACTISPQELRTSDIELVAQSEQIALVRVVGSSENNSDATTISHRRLGNSNDSLAILEPIKILRGHVPQRFKLSSGSLIAASMDPTRDMNGHRDIGFWDRKILKTRAYSGTDCRMHPGFVLGRIYLVFLDRPHFKAYEEVRSKDDLWLQAVQQVIENPNTQSGITMPVEDWLSMATGAFKGSVQSCDGPVLWVDEVLKGDFPNFLGFHFWWRYQEGNESGYWYANPCIDDNDYLVMTTYSENARLPYGDSIVAPIDGDTVDLSAAIEASEISVEGDRHINLDDVRAIFRGFPE